MSTAPTPRETVLRDGPARLYRFRRPHERSVGAGPPVLLVPSLINRWYVLDLRPGVSLAASLLDHGFDVFCLDWGEPGPEDRYLSWDDVVRRLARMSRRVRRMTGVDRIGLLGYCMGATLAGIYTALHQDEVAAFVNLAGPFDFSQSGMLGRMTDPRWFDADAVADAGNVPPMQMQSGFIALRPTQQLAKWVSLVDRAMDPDFRQAFMALETWANDNVAFPADAYRTYIRDLYQGNRLIAGEHHVGGYRVDLGSIRCPVLTIAAQRDTICPLPAARALNERVGSHDRELIETPGGHVGAVVGSRAPKKLYPAVGRWYEARLGGPKRSANGAAN